MAPRDEVMNTLQSPTISFNLLSNLGHLVTLSQVTDEYGDTSGDAPEITRIGGWHHRF